ncbi:N-acetylglucosamine kinase [Brachybacterium sp. DNPG3]
MPTSAAPPPAGPTPPSGGSPPPRVLLLGGDVGATRCRLRLHEPPPDAAIVGPGRTLARAEGPGYNPNSTHRSGFLPVADALREILEGVRGTEPFRVIAVLGIAGAGPAHHAEVQSLVRGALAELGIDREDVRVVDDRTTAFAAGAAGGDGLLLMAGTGAAAVRFEDHRPVTRCDGMGWLLGDTGSAVWMGREVLRAVAADLDRRGPSTALTPLLLDHLGIGAADPRQPLIAAVRGLDPAQWGTFAPIAQRVPADPTASGILREAADALIAAVDAVRGDPARGERSAGEPVRGASGPVVLTGSVLEHNPEVSRRVRTALAERGLAVLPARSPVEGALRIARRDQLLRRGDDGGGDGGGRPREDQTSISISPTPRDTQVVI